MVFCGIFMNIENLYDRFGAIQHLKNRAYYSCSVERRTAQGQLSPWEARHEFIIPQHSYIFLSFALTLTVGMTCHWLPGHVDCFVENFLILRRLYIRPISRKEPEIRTQITSVPSQLDTLAPAANFIAGGLPSPTRKTKLDAFLRISAAKIRPRIIFSSSSLS